MLTLNFIYPIDHLTTTHEPSVVVPLLKDTLPSNRPIVLHLLQFSVDAAEWVGVDQAALVDTLFKSGGGETSYDTVSRTLSATLGNLLLEGMITLRDNGSRIIVCPTDALINSLINPAV